MSLIFYFHLESPEGFGAALKAYQSLEPGDFTGFLKLLRSPASKRLQSRCTTFLSTMEAYHVMTSFWLVPNSPWPFRALLIVKSHFLQELPVQKQSDYVQDFYQSFAKYFKGEYISLHVIVYCLSWKLLQCSVMITFLFSGSSDTQVTQIMEHLEKLIMTRLYKWVFCHDSCDDEHRDLTLQRRIR